MLCFPIVLAAQTTNQSAERIAQLKAEAAAKAKAAEEAAQKALEAAKAAEEAAKLLEEEAARIAKEKASEEATMAQKAKEKAESERIAAEQEGKRKRLEAQQAEKQQAQQTEKQQQWAKPTIAPPVEKQSKQEIAKKDSEEEEKYLEGAVPLVNGSVEWEKTFQTSNTMDENYQRMLQHLATETKEKNQLPGSNVTLVNESEHTIVAHFEEWIVFASNFISMDRTKFIYTLIATCQGNTVSVRLFRINYIYEEERVKNSLIKAEEWITDKVCLNKAKTKLNRISGKFRRKTIDRKDEIFSRIEQALNN